MAPAKKPRLAVDYLRIGVWNMRLMRHKEEELAEEMKEYRLDILSVSETHLVRSRLARQ